MLQDFFNELINDFLVKPNCKTITIYVFLSRPHDNVFLQFVHRIHSVGCINLARKRAFDFLNSFSSDSVSVLAEGKAYYRLKRFDAVEPISDYLGFTQQFTNNFNKI